MTKRPLPTASDLRQLLRYEPDTGKLFWRARTPDFFPEGHKYSKGRNCDGWNRQYAGKEALTQTHTAGYKCGVIMDRKYRAHRVIWCMEHGDWPKGEVDHINHDRADNRVKNLRDVTTKENRRNQTIAVDNSSGATGVCWCKRRSLWYAKIQVGSRNKFLGYFDEKADAIMARSEANEKYGYHKRHGTSGQRY